MTAATLPAAAPPSEQVSLRDWVAVIAASIGCFMALLDISIVNTALPTIQGEIGASGTEGTWVTTSYIVAESIAIPLTGWLVRIFGLRRVMLGSILMFTIFSVFCGLAHNLTLMIIGRSAQGLTGGFLLPIVMLVIAERLPPSQQTTGFAIFGSTAVVGPVVGPLLGGYLTETLSWHYAFFINLPIGPILMALVWFSMPKSEMKPKELFDADWFGIVGLAVGLGCLTVVLEEGHREQWFESREIIWLSIAAAIGFSLLALGQVVATRPVLRLGMVRRWQFGLVILMGLVGGGGFYSTNFLVPQFLSFVGGYNAFEAGKVLIFGALVSIGLMAVTPMLARKIPARFIVAAGIATLASSALINAGISAETGAGAFIFTLILHGTGTTLAMAFLSQLAVAIVPGDERSDASAMFNAARNLGGTFGLSMIAALQDQRVTLHAQRMLETVSANSQAVQDHLAELVAIAGSYEGGLRLFDATVTRQALVMSYIDLFQLFGVALMCVVPLALLLPSMPKEELGGPPAH